MRKNDNQVRQKAGLKKKVVVVMIGGALLTGPVSAAVPANWNLASVPIAAAATSNSTLTLQNQSYITAGAQKKEYIWKTERSSGVVRANIHVIEINLANPYVQLNTMSGKKNTVGKLNTIASMTKENGAVAGINADVFITTTEGSPMGAQVTSGTLMASPMKIKGMYAFGVTKDREPTIDSYTFDGTVKAADGAAFTLAGLNQSAYVPETGGSKYSHFNQLHIYTSAWGGAERPRNASATPTEALIVDGVVKKISTQAALTDTIPEKGYILRGHGDAAKFITEHLQVGQKVTSDYSLVSATTGNKLDPSSFEMLVGGHTILVDKGEAASFSRDITGVSGSSYVSRSAVGYSKDGQKVYLITNEKYGDSAGLSLKDMQKVMVELGVYKGINLDGGGSTTMIDRPLGETSLQLTHSTQYGTTQRSVANGIGVFTTAPKGELKGVAVSGSNVLFIGQKASYTVKGYDTYYNPYELNDTNAKWSSSGGVGTLSGNEFTATKAGSAKISVKSGAITSSYAVDVIGQDQIAELKIDAAAGVLSKGANVSIPVTVTLTNGKTYKLTGDSLKWEFIGFTGSQKGNTLTVESTGSAQTGYAIGRYDGYPTMLPFTKGGSEKTLETFESVGYAINSQVTPSATTTGSVKLVSDLPGQTSNKALKISYDFSAGTGTKAVYAVFNGANGKTVDGSPTGMTVDVYGDGSLNWLRAEFTDADGKAHLVNLAKQLDWTGWKTVKADLASYGMKYPVKLKRVYVVTVPEGQDERAAKGAVGIDNMKLQYAAEPEAAVNKQIVMNIGKKAATVDGQNITLDVAPLELNGTTYVPLRFVTDAMGATLRWDDKLNRVSVIKGGTMLEMVIGKKEIVVNGTRSETAVAPIIRNGRTLIPVRLFSEKLGLKVGFESKTQKITID
ncbi:stalk domain-containing protein [Paenibacillus sp. NEAU-GSW1]|uniref:stalk domain-containing protein n=1 Tax=Paenibacillus sp. NEAU-GSW1 TaxID=2682486 RepID=UPI0012E0DF13|nr:stalk domain-containing protein [Paenibacillus sp. NEAU-GSW1]MUT65029.1 copper amine oxidase [Paenibacillus sp. NEAU-GSW1]